MGKLNVGVGSVAPRAHVARASNAVFLTLAATRAASITRGDVLVYIGKNVTSLVGVDEAVIRAHLDDVNELLTKPLTFDRLDLWRTLVNEEFFRSLFFGSIRWRKDDELLLTPNPIDAFDVQAYWVQDVLEYQPDGVHIIELKVPVYPPSKWVGPDDETYHYVNFLFSGIRDDINYYIDVTLTPQANWKRTKFDILRYHIIDKPHRSFTRNSGLAPFDVLNEPVVFTPVQP